MDPTLKSQKFRLIGFHVAFQEHAVLLAAAKIEDRSLARYVKRLALDHARALLLQHGQNPDEVKPSGKPIKDPWINRRKSAASTKTTQKKSAA